MTDSIMYHDGNRQLQDRFDSRRISDRLEEKLTRTQFTPTTRPSSRTPYFFLATADARGRPDCSYKGGVPGFVRVTGPSELAFPDYDGNGMFKSLGNILVNPSVGHSVHRHARQTAASAGQRRGKRERPRSASGPDRRRAAYRPGRARAIFPNCPRYIPTMQLIEPSIYAPRAGCEPPEPKWKEFADFRDCVHPRQPTFKG